MPRWKALPEELDSEVAEFAGQLRGLIDRSGLSITAVADRTGYSKASWERYLNGRLLAPKRAVVALADVTGTSQIHLTTMWELAERAWSRAEMRHDRTIEAIRISQARAALSESGPGSNAHAVTQTYGSARTPSVPAQRGAYGPATPPGGTAPQQQGSRRRLTMFVAAATGALMVISGAVIFAQLGDDGGGNKAAASPSAVPTTSAPELPAGVECTGADCEGQDPEEMGCGGKYAGTVSRVTVGGAVVEVRYSETCAAAWARITQATPGDTVRISAGAAGQDGTVDADRDAYTPMVTVKRASDAKACATLTSGTKGCTTPQ